MLMKEDLATLLTFEATVEEKSELGHLSLQPAKCRDIGLYMLSHFLLLL